MTVQALVTRNPDAVGAGASVADVRELRNRVAHYDTVVHHTGTEIPETGRNVDEPGETDATLAGMLDALHAWADAAVVDTTRRTHASLGE